MNELQAKYKEYMSLEALHKRGFDKILELQPWKESDEAFKYTLLQFEARDSDQTLEYAKVLIQIFKKNNKGYLMELMSQLIGNVKQEDTAVQLLRLCIETDDYTELDMSHILFDYLASNATIVDSVEAILLHLVSYYRKYVNYYMMLVTKLKEKRPAIQVYFYTLLMLLITESDLNNSLYTLKINQDFRFRLLNLHKHIYEASLKDIEPGTTMYDIFQCFESSPQALPIGLNNAVIQFDCTMIETIKAYYQVEMLRHQATLIIWDNEFHYLDELVYKVSLDIENPFFPLLSTRQLFYDASNKTYLEHLHFAFKGMGKAEIQCKYQELLSNVQQSIDGLNENIKFFNRLACIIEEQSAPAPSVSDLKKAYVKNNIFKLFSQAVRRPVNFNPLEAKLLLVNDPYAEMVLSLDSTMTTLALVKCGNYRIKMDLYTMFLTDLAGKGNLTFECETDILLSHASYPNCLHHKIDEYCLLYAEITHAANDADEAMTLLTDYLQTSIPASHFSTLFALSVFLPPDFLYKTLQGKCLIDWIVATVAYMDNLSASLLSSNNLEALRLSSRLRNPDAQREYATTFIVEGTSKMDRNRINEALFWYRLAALQGDHVSAMYLQSKPFGME